MSPQLLGGLEEAVSAEVAECKVGCGLDAQPDPVHNVSVPRPQETQNMVLKPASCGNHP